MAIVIRSTAASGTKESITSVNAIFTVPTFVSFLRIISIPFIIYYKSQGENSIALAITFLAGISDGVDGLLADLMNARTKFGSWIDPIADKLLHLIIFYFFPWIGLVIIITEIIGKQLSTPVREVYKEEGTMHYIAPYSKGITFAQMIALCIFSLLSQHEHEIIAALSIAALSVWRLYIYRGEYNRKVADNRLNRFDTIPNYITIAGLYLIPLILYVYSLDLPVSLRWIVIVLYCFVAWPTDWIDGKVAKWLKQKSAVGEILDTIRDVGLALLGMWMFDREAIIWLIPSQALSLYFYSKIKKITKKHTIPKLSRVITFALGFSLGFISLHTYWIEVEFFGMLGFLRNLFSIETLQITIIALPMLRALVYAIEWIIVYFRKQRYEISPYKDEA